MSKVIKAISYARVNTSRDYGWLRTQTDEIDVYAKQNGLKVVKIFESASTRYAKKELAWALNYCKHTPEVKFLLVHRIDRISRNMEEFFQWRNQFGGIGVQVKSITEPFDESPSGRFLQSLQLSLTEWESQMRSESIKRGIRRKKEAQT